MARRWNQTAAGNEIVKNGPHRVQGPGPLPIDHPGRRGHQSGEAARQGGVAEIGADIRQLGRDLLVALDQLVELVRFQRGDPPAGPARELVEAAPVCFVAGDVTVDVHAEVTVVVARGSDRATTEGTTR